MKHSGLFDSLEHSICFLCVSSKGLGAQDRFAGSSGCDGGLFMKMIRCGDDNDFDFGMLDGLEHIRRAVWDAPFSSELG
jgi:hypothetical protein